MCRTRSITAWLVRVVTIGVCSLIRVVLMGQEPILQLDLDGPNGFVTCLEFDREGRLYAGGWDKVVRVWRRDEQERYVLDRGRTMRVPIGTGLDGAINAVAVSSDGNLVAIAGRGVAKGTAQFRESGRLIPSLGGMTDSMRRDQGAIFLINPATHETHSLRGSLGPVSALEFSEEDGGSRILASASEEPSDRSESGSDSDAVIRLWDVASRKYIAGKIVRSSDPRNRPRVGLRPQLAVRRTVTGSLQVAVAWLDERFRVWNVDADRWTRLPDGMQNRAFSFLSSTRVVSGSLRPEGAGQIRLFEMSETPRIIDTFPSVFPPVNGVYSRPQAIAVLRGRSSRDPLLAVATETLAVSKSGSAQPIGVRLNLVDTNRMTVTRTVEIWRSRESLVPSLAASFDGEFVAVAGGPDRDVKVFRVADLIANRVQPQRLASPAVETVSARFVVTGDRHGLMLTERPDGLRSVFEFGENALQDVEGWTLDEPKVAQRVNEARVDGRIHLSLTPAGANQKHIRLPENQAAVDATALLPAGATTPVDVLAVASNDRGQPTLALYNIQSGEQFRQLTGHTERIRSLSISKDGRLLASTSADRTIRVWRMSDMKEIIGQYGSLAGVSVETGNAGDLVVAESDSASPAYSMLRVGDRLLGRIDDGDLVPWNQPRDFYDTFWLAKPGNPISIRRVRDSQRPRDVPIVVSQGIDEHKPLFSLFLQHNADGNATSWVGWTPLGQFEASDREIERQIGWHFNTDDPQRPTRFADLNQYREDYFMPGLLRELHRRSEGLVPQAHAPPPAPSLSLRFVTADDWRDPRDRLLFRSREKARLELLVDFQFPQELIRDITFRVNGRAIGNMTATYNQTWEIDLSHLAWTRGTHRVEAELHTSERKPRSFLAGETVHYVPDAPQVEITSQRTSSVRGNRFQFAARVVPSSANEPALARLYRVTDAERILVNQWRLREAGQIGTAVPIDPGSNQFQLLVQNETAGDEPDSVERVTAAYNVMRMHDQVAPPLLSVKLLGPAAIDRAITYGESIEVVVPQLNLDGQASCEESVASVSIDVAGSKRSLTFAVAPELPNTVAFRDTITGLTPGINHPITLTARTVGGLERSWTFDVRYSPPLPKVELTFPLLDPSIPTTDSAVAIEAGFQFQSSQTNPSSLLDQIEARVIVQSPTDPVVVEHEMETGRLRASVPLKLGVNQVHIELKYKWGRRMVAIGNLVPVTRVEPNFVTFESAVVQVGPDGTPQLTVRAKVRGVVSKLTVGGVELSDDLWSVNEDSGAMMFRLSRYEPSKAVNLVVGFQQGEAVRATVTNIQVQDGVFEPPYLNILSPNNDQTVFQREIKIRFSVKSKTRVTTIVVRRNRETISTATDEELRTLLDNKVHTFERSISLEPNSIRASGGNEIEIIAGNEGGLFRKVAVIVSCIPVPVHAEIDQVTLRGGQGSGDSFELGSVIPLADGPSGLRAVDAAASPLAMVHGRVIWSDSDDAQLKQPLRVKVWVNGFQQAQVWLTEPQGHVRFFEIPILLTRSENVIEVDLPDITSDVSNRLTFGIACGEPNEARRIHLVTVGIGQRANANVLLDNMLNKVLHARDRLSASFMTDVFYLGRIYEPLVGEAATKRKFLGMLTAVNSQVVTQRVADEEASDLVVIYYSGGELIFDDQQFYLTTWERGTSRESSNRTDDAISSGDLASFIESTPGGHLLLLDVTRQTEERKAFDRVWPDLSHSAMLRYAWLDPARDFPDQAQMLTALVEIVRQSSTLGEIDQRLDENFRTYNQQAARDVYDLDYNRQIPEPLRLLQLTKAP